MSSGAPSSRSGQEGRPAAAGGAPGSVPPGSANSRAVAPARLGVLLALIVLVADQASKLWVLFGAGLASRPPITLAPFLEFTLVWNRGISYGLFQTSDGAGRWLLVAVTLLATVALSIWLMRARSLLLACGLGLIIGGATGNLIDRIWWGAVVDFVHFHAGSFSWYVFNVADAAIVAGVAALLWDSFRLQHAA